MNAIKAVSKEIIRADMSVLLPLVIREKRFGFAMDNPFVVEVCHKFEDEINLYLIMELAVYGDLTKQLQKGVATEDNATKVMSQAACGLEYGHACNVVHCDIKPENILVYHTGRVKLCDFGVAGFDTDGLRDAIGTREFRAPEMLTAQTRGSTYSFPVDWWAFGITLYEILLDGHPFRASGQGIIELERNIVNGEIQDLNDLALTAEAKHLIEKLLLKDPETRLGSGAMGASEVKNLAWFRHIDYHKLIYAEDGHYQSEQSNDLTEFLNRQPFEGIGPRRDQAFEDF